MKAPWADKSGTAKAVAVLATVALVSLGMCGVNFVAVIAAQNSAVTVALLMVAAYLELAGMVIGVGGLVVVLIFSMVKAMVSSFQRRKQGRGE